jgi:hypothetical protein
MSKSVVVDLKNTSSHNCFYIVHLYYEKTIAVDVSSGMLQK